MDFQRHLQNGWRLLKAHPLILLVGGLLIQFLIALSLGVLAGPLAGGYLVMIIRYYLENHPPGFNDLFSGLHRAAHLVPFFLLALLIALGFFFFVVPGIIFLTWWLYTLPLMADRALSLGAAMRKSRRKVQEKGFFMHLVFLVLITLIPSLLINLAALIIPPLEILHLALFPAQSAVLASLYLEQFDNERFAANGGRTPNNPAAATG